MVFITRIHIKNKLACKKNFAKLLSEMSTNLEFAIFENSEQEEMFLAKCIISESLDFTEMEKADFQKELKQSFRVEGKSWFVFKYLFFVFLFFFLIFIFFYNFKHNTVQTIGTFIIFCLIGLGYLFYVLNYIKEDLMKIIDLNLIRHYSKWTFTKLDEYKDDINKRRVLIENFIGKYTYFETMFKQDYEDIRKAYFNEFLKLYKNYPNEFILSFKIYFFISKNISLSRDDFLAAYYIRMIYPLINMFNSNKKDLQTSFKDFIGGLSIVKKYIEMDNVYETLYYFKYLEKNEVKANVDISISDEYHNFFIFNDIANNDDQQYSLELNKFIEDLREKHMKKTQCKTKSNQKIPTLQSLQAFNNPLDMIINESNMSVKINSFKDVVINMPDSNASILFDNKKEGSSEIHQLLQLANEPDDNFEQITNSNKMIILKKINKKDSVITLKVYIELSLEPTKVFLLLHNIEWRQKWEELLKNMKIVKSISEDEDIVYYTFDSVLGTGKRYFHQRRKVYKNQQGFEYIINFTDDDQDKSNRVKEGTKITTITFGHILKRMVNNRTHLTTVCELDYNGLVPNWIKDYVLSILVKQWVKKLIYGTKLIRNVDIVENNQNKKRIINYNH